MIYGDDTAVCQTDTVQQLPRTGPLGCRAGGSLSNRHGSATATDRPAGPSSWWQSVKPTRFRYCHGQARWAVELVAVCQTDTVQLLPRTGPLGCRAGGSLSN